MSARSSTPGPWYASVNLRGMECTAPGIDIGAADNSNVALAHHEASDRPESETRANARLIAAAPDLLSAAKHVSAWLEKEYSDELYILIDILDAAIAKAVQP